MYKILIIILTFMVNFSFAQTNFDKQTINRKGFTFSVGFGGGALTMNTNDTLQTTFAPTFPNIKLGYMVNDRLALMAMFPGSTYKQNDQLRGFEAVMIAGQYWLTDKWWVLSSAGFTFDAPAFYTVKEFETAEFYTGIPALAFATGFEIFRIRNFTVDLQYRAFYGKSNLSENSHRSGFSNMFIIGFNWY